MIQNSFIHIKGVTKEIESFLWKEGILNWKDLKQNLDVLREKLPPVFFEEELIHEIERGEFAYENRDILYFWSRIPYAEAWRFFGDFSEVFWGLDIETTGLGHPHIITCICVSNGRESQTYQFTRTKNLDDFYDFWETHNSGILVTYNGFQFDLPFLKRAMDWVSPIPHIDLMHVLHKMGIKGGLKGSEEKLGIQRKKELQSINGNTAVSLWKMYLDTDREEYLDLLEEYNQADTINLIRIMEIVYARKKEKIFSLQ